MRITVLILSMFILGVSSTAPVLAQPADSFDTDKFMGNLQKELANYKPGDTTGAKTVSLPAVQHQQSQSLGMVVMRIIGYLAVLIALFIGIAWLIKRGSMAGRSRLGAGSMDVLEVLPLGPQRTVVLVRVLDTVYLLGQTPQNISLLEKIDGQKAMDVVTSAKGVSLTKFKDAFNQFFDKLKRQP